MKLIKLELQGFKSFADRTEFNFDSGATVIVGPNGCGKSNVVDAFKWVLGEQSAKSLRGDGMQDVIFNGSSTRKPAGMAEVVLTFDNSDGKLPVEQAEVQVGRRLYRDGSSEYLLNKQTVRLRDIRELFMDTGVGVDAYSLVEQGKVDQVLASNTVDRRMIFEEAAGISKYRSRKREAARKLERVDQNLLRLTDIVNEVDRRLRSIKAAATKARNFQELSGRLRELRVSHFVWDYHRLSESLVEAAARLTDDARNVAKLSGRQAELQVRLQSLDEEQLSAAGQLADVENRLVQIASQMTNHHDRIRYNSDREKELADEFARKRLADVALRARIGELACQDHELSAATGRLDADAEAARAQIEQIAREQHAADVEISELADQTRRAGETLFDLVRQASQLANQLHQHKTAQENLSAQRSRLASRADEVARQLESRNGERNQLRQDLADRDGRLADLQQQFDATKAAAQAKDAAIRELASRLGGLKERRSALTARRDLLASLEQKGEGLADGPRAVLEGGGVQPAAGDANDDWRPAMPGIAGLVADLLMVPPGEDANHLAETAAAVAAALGELEQAVVIRDSAALAGEPAQQLLASLPGPATLLCLDKLAGLEQPDLTPLLGQPGVIGPADELVACEPVFLPVRRYLLGNIVRVQTLDDALRLCNSQSAIRSVEVHSENCFSIPHSVRFLTRDGVLVGADGRILAPAGREADASAASPAALGLIGRRAELRELAGQLENLAGQVAELESQLAAESADAAELDRDGQQLRGQIYAESTARVEFAARLRQAEQAIDSLSSEQAMLASESTDLTSRIETAAAAERATAEKIAQLDDRRAGVQRQADDLNARLAELRTSAEQLNRRMTDAKVALGQVEERRRSARQQLATVRRGLEEARAQQATAGSDRRSLLQRIAQSQVAQLSAGQAIAELFAARDGLTEQRSLLARQVEQVRQALADADAAARAIGHELHTAEEARYRAESARNELRVRLESLVQRVADEHQIDLPMLYETNPPSADDGAVDWPAVEAEIADLRGRIDRLGSVNIEAIDEQEQLDGRSTFLHGQLADVTSAKSQLETLIERINVESRRRFETTFNEVREQFRELFRKLFGGGKADLVLENPDDVLESGIEIVARPPGKELRSITLLSGGEKTMTALALLMSIFRSRPSPFCILDEVDAALDEANNERFNSIIREFLDFSQFIIITHSKATMTVADVLYGVTMQEQGVSKQVAVRFDGRTVRGGDGEELEEPATRVA